MEQMTAVGQLCKLIIGDLFQVSRRLFFLSGSGQIDQANDADGPIATSTANYTSSFTYSHHQITSLFGPRGWNLFRIFIFQSFLIQIFTRFQLKFRLFENLDLTGFKNAFTNRLIVIVAVGPDSCILHLNLSGYMLSHPLFDFKLI